MNTISRGGVFGKVAVLMNARQLFTVRTTSLTTVLKLERDNLSDILRTYPKDARQVYYNLKVVSGKGKWKRKRGNGYSCRLLVRATQASQRTFVVWLI